MLGASGAVEAAVSAGAMIRGILPPTCLQTRALIILGC